MNWRMHMLKWRALWLAIGWALVAVVVYLSLAPLAMELPVQDGDKYAHTAAYAALMLWFMQIYEGRRACIVVALGLIALGAGLEVLQGYMGYRNFEYADMAANMAGVAVGWLVSPPRTPNMLLRVERLRLRSPAR